MNGFERLITSIRRHGWRKTAGLVPEKIGICLSKAGDRRFDARHGTITRRVVELGTLDITSVNKVRGIRYEPTRARPLQRLLERLRLPRRATFVDFGCGMGRVLLIAAEYGFERVVGVDFSSELCDRARDNVTDYTAKHGGRELNVTVVHNDAINYVIQPQESIFYFFNPFDAGLMATMLDKILQSHREHPRKVWLIYHNPIWRDVFDTQQAIQLDSEHRFADCRFNVYRIPEE
jgi:SAM-dependent methyltransferase